ncbi:MAG: hypothetical protein ACREHV_14730 [Rhizomicrobium sp.]
MKDELNWPVVLQKAEEARNLFADRRTRTEGRRQFEELTRDYPSDLMVDFKYAEALEALYYENEKVSGQMVAEDGKTAIRRYRKAAERFKKPLWRDLARSRAERLDKEIQSSQIREEVRRTLGGGAKRLTLIEESIEESAWLAGTFTKDHPFISLELSRTALVRAIKEVENRRQIYRVASYKGIGTWPERLKAFNLRDQLAESAKKVLRKRDGAVYYSKPVSEADAKEAFETVLKFLRQTFAGTKPA